MSVDRIVSLEERRVQQEGRHAAAASQATALWTSFIAGGADEDAEAECNHGGMRTRILLVMLSVVGSSGAVTAWMTMGWLYGVGVYIATLMATGLILWRSVRRPGST